MPHIIPASNDLEKLVFFVADKCIGSALSISTKPYKMPQNLCPAENFLQKDIGRQGYKESFAGKILLSQFLKAKKLPDQCYCAFLLKKFVLFKRIINYVDINPLVKPFVFISSVPSLVYISCHKYKLSPAVIYMERII